MSTIEIKTEFVVDGLSFPTRKAAEEHLASIKLHMNVTAALRTQVIGFGVTQDELIVRIVDHLVKDRVAVRAILNAISGWEDNKVDDPKMYDQLKKLIKVQERVLDPLDPTKLWSIPALVPMEPPVARLIPGMAFDPDASWGTTGAWDLGNGMGHG